jgi:hypothetical protein
MVAMVLGHAPVVCGWWRWYWVMLLLSADGGDRIGVMLSVRAVECPPRCLLSLT